MKKILCIVLSLCLLTAIPTAAYANDTANTFNYEEAYEWAIEVGFPEEFISKISESYLKKIYLENVGVDELEVTASVAYLSEDNNPNARNNISSSHLEFWNISGKVTSGGVIQYVNVYTFYDWIAPKPIVKGVDVIEVSWDSSLWIFGTNSFSATLSDSLRGAYRTLSRPDGISNGEIAWSCLLTPAANTPSGEASFKLLPVDTQMADGSRYRSQVSANYDHQVLDISSLNISVNDFGITVTGTYDEAAASSVITYGR